MLAVRVRRPYRTLTPTLSQSYDEMGSKHTSSKITYYEKKLKLSGYKMPNYYILLPYNGNKNENLMKNRLQFDIGPWPRYY